jgi:hypothetical protein
MKLWWKRNHTKVMEIVGIVSLPIAIISLFFAYDSYTIVHQTLSDVKLELHNVEYQLMQFQSNTIFLRTKDCERIWFRNGTEVSFAGCYNGTKWNICAEGLQSNACNRTSWLKEVQQTFSWKNTNGTW